ISAVHAMVGIGAALYRRAMTGQGEFLDVAMMDSMHTVMSYEYAAAQFPSDQGPIVFRPMQTLDGFLAIAPVSQANFAALARAAGHEQWLEDPRFSARDERIKNWSTMLDLIEAWTRTTTSGAAEAALLAEGCPASAYRTIGEARVDDQVRFRGAAVEVADAVGSFEVPNSPIQFRHAHSQPGPTVPELGQDGDAILAELGYSLEQVAALRQGGALAE
ncbi:MAG: CoA transferase, partial [Chromatiales bacterium]|nr:CoA transferase [Chromatiales bacterium]